MTSISNKTLIRCSKKNSNNNLRILGSQPHLNNHQFNFDNNLQSLIIPRTKNEQSLIIYKDIRQVQQQLNCTNHSLQHLTQQTTKFLNFCFLLPREGR